MFALGFVSQAYIYIQLAHLLHEFVTVPDYSSNTKSIMSRIIHRSATV